MTNAAVTNLTEEQRAALGAHDRSVSLAAGAGCGKTFVLTERFLSYVDPQLDVPSAELEELVAITFTDASAREMRDRIRRRCYERLQQADGDDPRQAWQRLIRAMDGARISTIHSFCAGLLRSHAVEVEVDPRFELLDPPAAELLRLQTLDDRLRELLLAGDERVIQLATRFQLRNLRDYLARLLGENTRTTIARWRGSDADRLVATWTDYFHDVVIPVAVQGLAQAEPVRKLDQFCQSAVVVSDKLHDHLQQIVATIADVNVTDQPHAVLESLHTLARVQGVCKKDDWADENDFAEFRQLSDAVRKVVRASPLRQPLVDQQLHDVADAGLELLELVADVTEYFDQAKRDRNALEFDDVLARAHRLLTDPRFPEVRQQLADGTRLLMVDEFQDTDPLQVAIVQAFRGENWAEAGLFVVGDFKQSIYRFRGAEPRVSAELRATLPAESRLSLTTNFRSQPAILDFVNALFFDGFADGYEPLRAARSQLSPTPAVEFLWASGVADDDPHAPGRRRTRVQQARAREARFIAGRLAQMLESEENLIVDASDGPRPLRLGDVAILLRTLSDVALYEEALRAEGLDYYLAGGHAFYAQQEIHDILHLLRAVANPADELSLAGALRSPIFSLEDETLFWLVDAHSSLNRGVLTEEPPAQLGEDQRERVLRAGATLRELRDRKDHLLVAQLLNLALKLTGYDATLLAEFMGQRKLANVNKLVEQARTLDRTRPGDLSGFITQLSELVVRAPKEPPAATRAEGDVIRIMTIHHAKGLEFPLVVVPDLNRRGRPADRQPVFDERLGPLVPAEDKQALVGYDLFRFVERQQDEEERQRLLYVACTRAADYLLLSSSIDDLAKPTSDWLKLLGGHFDLASGRCLVDLPPDIAAPQVRVTREQPGVEGDALGKSRGADLIKLVSKTRKLAADGQGVVPPAVEAVPVDTQARRRFSFSRLSGELASSGPGTEYSVPSTQYSVATIVDARGLGSLVHAVLERIDFAQPVTDLVSLCEHLARQHVEDQWQAAAAEATDLVQRFLSSPRATQLATARDMHREVEFLLPWPPGQSDGRGHYLHGFIDCLYQDVAGDWRLVDYKSNNVAAAGVPQAAEHYAMQMFVYGLACEQALGARPVETVLCFLRPGVEFAFDWEKNSHAEMIAQLDAAIQSQRSPI